MPIVRCWRTGYVATAVCDTCHRPFYARPSQLAAGRGKTCSRECQQNSGRVGAIKTRKERPETCRHGLNVEKCRECLPCGVTLDEFVEAFPDGATFDEIGSALGCSRQNVEQILARILERVRQTAAADYLEDVFNDHDPADNEGYDLLGDGGSDE